MKFGCSQKERDEVKEFPLELDQGEKGGTRSGDQLSQISGYCWLTKCKLEKENNNEGDLKSSIGKRRAGGHTKKD